MVMKQWLLILALCPLWGCGSSDSRGMEEAVRIAISDRPNLRVSEPVIYRDGDDRRSCVIATYDNDWGEPQPPMILMGVYQFKLNKWTAFPIQTITDGSAGNGACEAMAGQAQMDTSVMAPQSEQIDGQTLDAEAASTTSTSAPTTTTSDATPSATEPVKSEPRQEPDAIEQQSEIPEKPVMSASDRYRQAQQVCQKDFDRAYQEFVADRTEERSKLVDLASQRMEACLEQVRRR